MSSDNKNQVKANEFPQLIIKNYTKYAKYMCVCDIAIIIKQQKYCGVSLHHHHHHYEAHTMKQIPIDINSSVFSSILLFWIPFWKRLFLTYTHTPSLSLSRSQIQVKDYSTHEFRRRSNNNTGQVDYVVSLLSPWILQIHHIPFSFPIPPPLLFVCWKFFSTSVRNNSKGRFWTHVWFF